MSELARLDTEPMAPQPHRITRVRRETGDAFTLELERANGGAISHFTPGQFNMLYVFGIGEAAISISGNPADTERLVHTIRAVGSVTSAMRKLKKGHFLGVRGPYGGSWPLGEAEGGDVVIVAGGIGLAPLRPLIYQVVANRKLFGRVALLYGARTESDLLYRKELEQWKGRFDTDVLITVDRATQNWRGNVGVVPSLIPHASFDPYHAYTFLCGPEIMMMYTAEALLDRGVTADRIHVSLERNMKCAVGFCGHCQYGPKFICKDGPVFRYDAVERLLRIREI